MTEPTNPREFTPQERLAAALVAARKDMKPVPLSATAKIKSPKGAGSSYAFKFAPLPKIIELVSPVLAKHGLMLSTVPVKGCLRIVLTHDGGGTMSFEGPEMPPPGNDLQAWGKACTYLRRYCVMGLLGLAADEDADGDALPAPRRTAPKPQAPPQTEAQPPADAPSEEAVLERVERGFQFLRLDKQQQADLWEQHQHDPDGLLMRLQEMARQAKAGAEGREPGEEG